MHAFSTYAFWKQMRRYKEEMGSTKATESKLESIRWIKKDILTTPNDHLYCGPYVERPHKDNSTVLTCPMDWQKKFMIIIYI